MSEVAGTSNSLLQVDEVSEVAGTSNPLVQDEAELLTSTTLAIGQEVQLPNIQIELEPFEGVQRN